MKGKINIIRKHLSRLNYGRYFIKYVIKDKLNHDYTIIIPADVTWEGVSIGMSEDDRDTLRYIPGKFTIYGTGQVDAAIEEFDEKLSKCL